MSVFVIYRLSVGKALIGETRERFEPMPAQSSPAALELDPRGEAKEKAAA
jgi:hypothetical protein